MAAVVIDTSTWVEILERGHVSAAARSMVEDGLVHVPPLVAAEILSGRYSPGRRRYVEEALGQLPWCTVDRAHWFRVGAMRAELRGRGVTVSTPDAHVAQCALDLEAVLWTEDAVFALVARHTALRLGDWRLDA